MSRGARAAALVALGAAAACDGGAADRASTAAERTCSESLALSAATYKGASLPPLRLALSFDDGPGTRTAELSGWLAAQGISATFFVNGVKVAAQPGILAKLAADGHAVANHTQDHHDLTTFPPGAAGDAAILAEVADTDAIIAPFVPAGRFLFRAPYGAYDARANAVLHASAMDKYVGPIGWDIGGARTATSAADWACWQDEPKLTSRACGDLYMSETGAVGHGIVLFHDADYGDVANTALDSGVGNTIDMVKYLVPKMRAQGFTFVHVADVPEIAAALPPLPAAAHDAGADADAGAPSLDGGPSSADGAAPPDEPHVPPASVVAAPPTARPCGAPSVRAEQAH